MLRVGGCVQQLQQDAEAQLPQWKAQQCSAHALAQEPREASDHGRWGYVRAGWAISACAVRSAEHALMLRTRGDGEQRMQLEEASGP